MTKEELITEVSYLINMHYRYQYQGNGYLEEILSLLNREKVLDNPQTLA